jgi:hypothetical protein
VLEIPPERLEALRKLAIAELWRRRAFWPLLEHYLDRDQLADTRRFFEGVDPTRGQLPALGWYDDISRQRGKSYKWCAIAIVWCHCHPGQFIKYAAQLGVSVRGIVAPTINKLVRDMPENMRPLEDRQDHLWRFPKGPGEEASEIKAAGVNMGHYDDLRGPKSHIIIEDEAAFYDEFEKVQEVLGPQLQTTGGVKVYATTPPWTPEHPLREIQTGLKQEGRYSHRTIQNHPRMSQEEIDIHLTAMAKERGMNLQQFRRTTYYRREYLCMWVAEETRAIVPEWSAVADDDNPEAGTLGDRLTYKERLFPEFFAYAEALDIGFTRDPSGYIQAHWDFKEACLYVHAELPPLHRKRTDELAAAIKGCREAHVPTSLPPPHVDAVRHSSGTHWLPYLSVGDAGGNGAEKLAELAKHHDIHFVHAEKTDLESMVDELRVLIRQEKVRVHESCKNLLKQLASGLWADKGKSDFERTPHHHNDHLIALVYLVRMLAGLRAFNPYPPYHGQDPGNMVLPEPRPSSGIKAIKDVLE